MFGVLSAIPETDSSKIRIPDPNSENPGAVLEGAQAFSSIVSQSALGKISTGFNIKNFQQTLTSDSDPTSDRHGDTSDLNENYDPTAENQNPPRWITVKQDLTPEEAQIFEEKITELRSANMLMESNIPYKIKWGTPDWADTKEEQTKIRLLGSRAAGKNNVTFDKVSIRSDLRTYYGQTAYPCASVIELALKLNSVLKIKFEVDLDRGLRDISSEGNDPYLSDHPGGRAIDLRHIARKNEPFMNLADKDPEKNFQALSLLLETLNAMPKFIHPDLIVFDDRLTEYGVERGFGGGAVLKKKYSNISDISFGLDKGHRDHMHIAFGPYRAGNYLDYTSSDLPGEENGPENIPTTVPPQNYTVDAKTLLLPRKADGNKLGDQLTAEEQKVTYRALVKYGKFKPETAALFMMLAERESRFRPTALNANISRKW